MSDHAALDSGGFGAHPCTLTRPWRVVFDGLVKAFKQWRRWQIGTIHEVGGSRKVRRPARPRHLDNGAAWSAKDLDPAYASSRARSQVLLYWNWPYVLVAAGPTQALSWRTGHMRGADVLPDRFFPKIDPGWSLPSGTTPGRA